MCRSVVPTVATRITGANRTAINFIDRDQQYVSMAKHCRNCEQNVNPEGRVNWLIFTVLFLFAVVPGLVYLVYCLIIKSPTCPTCGDTNFGPPADGPDASG